MVSETLEGVDRVSDDHRHDPQAHDPQALRSQVDRGFELHETGDLDAALDFYDALLASPPSGGDPVTIESLFAARFDRAVVLTELGELGSAADAYAQAAGGLPADDPEVQHEIAMAEVNRGICLDLLGDHEGALAVYSGVVARFPDPTDPVTREQVTKAMVNRATVLATLERWDEALTAADEVLDHVAAGDDLWIDEQRGMALRARALALVTLGRPDEALDAYADAIALADAVDAPPPVRAQAAAAMREQAGVLGELDRRDEAVALIDLAEQRFGGDDEPVVTEVLAEALRDQARLLEAAGDADRAVERRSRAAQLEGLA